MFALILLSVSFSSSAENGAQLALPFQLEVDRRLDVPEPDQARYAQLLESALSDARIPLIRSQYVLLVDRNPNVQAIFLYWLDSQVTPGLQLATESLVPPGLQLAPASLASPPPEPSAVYLRLIGASPVSSGKPGKFDYFLTPEGVFAHTLDNQDYRAEGTFNKLGIRGFGIKGRRVFDFGWVLAERGWGGGGYSEIRLLIHATDPDRLELRLGLPMSKGCVRIPATLNTFLDRYGVLDGDYEQARANGKNLWVLRSDRLPTPWPGRYLVIIDSGSKARPSWSPDPMQKHRLSPAGHGRVNSATTTLADPAIH
ncbi:MAG: L,D-transpeptidase [Gallionella sp.]|nr:L,D-transpeptidase [Gallionella sp.]